MSDHDLLTALGLSDLGPALRDFVLRQRWFGGRAKTVAGTDVVDVGLLREGNPTCLFLTLRVRYADGNAETYNTPIGIRDAGDVDGDVAPQHLIAELDGEQGRRVVVDALADSHCGA